MYQIQNIIIIPHPDSPNLHPNPPHPHPYSQSQSQSHHNHNSTKIFTKLLLELFALKRIYHIKHTPKNILHCVEWEISNKIYQAERVRERVGGMMGNIQADGQVMGVSGKGIYLWAKKKAVRFAGCYPEYFQSVTPQPSWLQLNRKKNRKYPNSGSSKQMLDNQDSIIKTEKNPPA